MVSFAQISYNLAAYRNKAIPSSCICDHPSHLKEAKRWIDETVQRMSRQVSRSLMHALKGHFYCCSRSSPRSRRAAIRDGQGRAGPSPANPLAHCYIEGAPMPITLSVTMSKGHLKKVARRERALDRLTANGPSCDASSLHFHRSNDEVTFRLLREIVDDILEGKGLAIA
jgi:hypothetical protein